jgi:hypothetical protein
MEEEVMSLEEIKARILADSIKVADSLVAIADTGYTVEEIKEITPEKITLKKDSIISNEKKIIHGNTYFIRRYDDEGWRTGFKMVLYKDGDSSVVFDGDDSYRGGNCNITSALVTSHDIQRDILIISYYEKVNEHMDDTDPHYSSDTWRETYAIQKKGSIVRLKTEYGKNDSLLDAMIRAKLEDALNDRYAKY